jgi:ubiquinone/menaquinone biosynthesis C-methylase UbiE
MPQFDRYKDSYEAEIEQAVSFSGRSLDFFTSVKTRRLLDVTRRHFADPNTLRALDVGCGTGVTDRQLATEFASLHGTDISPAMLERAAETNPDVTYEIYDGHRLPYDDDSFDLTFTICVLHHVPPSSWGRFLSELRRVTSPRGGVVVFEHNPLNPLTRLVVSRCSFDEDAVLLKPSKLQALLGTAGLEPLEASYLLFFPWQSKFLDAAEQGLRRLPLGAQYLVAARA